VLAGVVQATTAAERLGVSFAPPPTQTAPTVVSMPTFSESAAAWSSETATSSGQAPPRRFPLIKLIVTVAIVIAAGKGAMVGFAYAKESLRPAALSEGDCISFDAQGLNPHVSSCGEIHFGKVVRQVEQATECAGVTDYWIQKDEHFYCILREP
jgi:hypothetical protein